MLLEHISAIVGHRLSELYTECELWAKYNRMYTVSGTTNISSMRTWKSWSRENAIQTKMQMEGIM